MSKLYIYLLNIIASLRLYKRIIRNSEDVKDLKNGIYKFSQRIFSILNTQRDIYLSIIIQLITVN